MHTHFFGYGSLVNAATHAFEDAHIATLSGWRRHWVQTGLRRAAFLSASRVPGAEISGMIAHVPPIGWATLDARERAYDRHPVADAVRHSGPPDAAIVVYSVAPENRQHGDHPILLSYLDVVVQGYLNVFGETGASDFFKSTDGWEAGVLDDRAQPIYPRHQRLSPSERGFVDDQLAQRGIRVTPL